jgi:phenylacetate-CoA ligase
VRGPATSRRVDVPLEKSLRQFIKKHPAIQVLSRKLIAAVPYRLRLGRNFFHWYALFLESESWSAERVAEFRHRLLADLLREVSASSPYYAELLGGVAPDTAARDIGAYLPVMGRDGFRSGYDRIRNHAYRGRLSAASTSGTTGNALQFFHSAEDNLREWAAICHQWRRVGYDPLRSIRAEFRGLLTQPGIVQHFPESRMIRFSILHMKEEHVRHYAQVCAADKVEFIHGYPSAIYLLAREIVARGIVFPKMRGIMLASEMPYQHQLDAIAAAFPDTPVIAHYGNAERVALGAWCERERSYHFLPLYSQVEVDPADGSLIGTNYFNTVNPFIRYRMSDIMLESREGACGSCGRLATPLVKEIGGRAEDYLFSPDKGWIPPAIVTYPLKSLRRIHEIQFYQEQPDRIELRYVPQGDGDCSAELDEIRRELAKILGSVEIVAVRRESFERGSTGKFKWIVSRLDPDFRHDAVA